MPFGVAGTRSKRMPLAMTIRTESWCISMPPALCTWPLKTPASQQGDDEVLAHVAERNRDSSGRPEDDRCGPWLREGRRIGKTKHGSAPTKIDDGAPGCSVVRKC